MVLAAMFGGFALLHHGPDMHIVLDDGELFLGGGDSATGRAPASACSSPASSAHRRAAGAAAAGVALPLLIA
jgi:TfoX/Sxy family transcriptional regulator of competence genes